MYKYSRIVDDIIRIINDNRSKKMSELWLRHDLELMLDERIGDLIDDAYCRGVEDGHYDD